MGLNVLKSIVLNVGEVTVYSTSGYNINVTRKLLQEDENDEEYLFDSMQWTKKMRKSGVNELQINTGSN